VCTNTARAAVGTGPDPGEHPRRRLPGVDGVQDHTFGRPEQGDGLVGGRRGDPVPLAHLRVVTVEEGVVHGAVESQERSPLAREAHRVGAHLVGRRVGAHPHQRDVRSPQEGEAEEEARQRAARRRGDEHPGGPPIRGVELSGELHRGCGVPQRAQRRGRAQRHHQRLPSRGGDLRGGAVHGRRALLPGGDGADVRPEEPLQEGVPPVRLRRRAVHHEHAPQPQVGGEPRRDPAVVGLGPPRRDEVRDPFQAIAAQLELELAHLVPAQRHAGLRVHLHVDLGRGGAEAPLQRGGAHEPGGERRGAEARPSGEALQR
jgi:hypothetical protein